MLGITDLKPGIYFLLDNEPHEVLEAQHSKYAQRRPVLQAKLRNLRTGKVAQRTFLQSDTFKEAELEKTATKYLYQHRDQYWFSAPDNPSERFSLTKEQLGDETQYLKQNLNVETIRFEGELLNVELPIKVEYKVTEAPPGLKGDTAQGGTKTVEIETGLKLQAPLFINTGDTILVNTKTGEYVERMEKA